MDIISDAERISIKGTETFHIKQRISIELIPDSSSSLDAFKEHSSSTHILGRNLISISNKFGYVALVSPVFKGIHIYIYIPTYIYI